MATLDAVDPVMLEAGESTRYTDAETGKVMKIKVEAVEPETIGAEGDYCPPVAGAKTDMRYGAGSPSRSGSKTACRYGAKCRKMDDAEHCARFSHPEDAMRERKDREMAKKLHEKEVAAASDADDAGKGGGKGKGGKDGGKDGGKGGGKGRKRWVRYKRPDKPIVMEDPVWGRWEFPPGTEPTPYDVVCWSGCPCCVHGYICAPYCGGRCRGPGMTADKKQAWKKFLCSFSMLFSVVQTVLVIISIWVIGDGIDKGSGWLLGPSVTPLIDLGAKYTWAILEKNEWWRLAMPIMLHGGWVHLFMNLSMQVRIGMNLEIEWGHARFLVIYLLSGIYSFIASAVLIPTQVSVGCSGALMGIMGAWFVWSWITWSKDRELITRIIEILVLGTSILIVVCQSWMPRVDWACHAGGLVSGAALAMALFAHRLTVKHRRIATCISGCVLFLALFAGTLVPLIMMDPDQVLKDMIAEAIDAGAWD